jgi:hypothetical protein
MRLLIGLQDSSADLNELEGTSDDGGGEDTAVRPIVQHYLAQHILMSLGPEAIARAVSHFSVVFLPAPNLTIIVIYSAIFLISVH